jgi:protein-serine/threonine kinase
MTEHEHGLGASGLRRIRQQPPLRAPTLPPSTSSSRAGSVAPRSNSMSLNLPGSRKSSSGAFSPGPASPTLFTEDLTRFPSESLHSFSFAHQSEEFIHNRQNVLKRSIEFMKDRLGWAASSAGIASAQARVSGDQDMQSMLELLTRAKLVGPEGVSGHGLGLLQGPMTGPARIDGENVFDRSFFPRSESPELYSTPTSPNSSYKRPMEPPVKPVAGAAEESTQRNDLEVRIPTRPDGGSEISSRTPTDESRTTAKTSPPQTRRQSLKRTFTDIEPLTLQNKLMDAMAQPYITAESGYNAHLLSPTASHFTGPSSFGVTGPHPLGPAVHGHASRWAPAAQAIFTTESKAPWTILAANDLACLVFGVTKAEVRKMGILEVVREERRAWLEEKLRQPGSEAEHEDRPSPQSQSQHGSPVSSTSFLVGRGGLTASLLSKPPSRSTTPTPRRAQTDDGAGSSVAARKKAVKGGPHHTNNKSRGVLLCGDVVPIQKRNGCTGSASLWVKEKRGGLIWVLEEIHEDVTLISLDDDGLVTKVSGSTEPIWGENLCKVGTDIGRLIPRIPRQGIDPRTGEIDYAEVAKRKYFTARNVNGINIPAAVEKVAGTTDLQVSSFPHIAGILVLNSKDLEITSSNSVFSAALFGQQHPDGLLITDLIPEFDRIIRILTDEDGVRLVDGIVIPEHSFRRAQAFLALRDGKADAASYFLRPDGLPAKHRDGSEIKIDVQMRVVKSDKHMPVHDENVIIEEDDAGGLDNSSSSEVVYALWITYSRNLHASHHDFSSKTPQVSGPVTPLHQPSPGQTHVASPIDMDSDEPKKETSHASILTKQLKEAAMKTAAKLTGHDFTSSKVKEEPKPPPEVVEPVHKKTIEDFVILEEMGQGAYGQVKLARYKKTGSKVVLKYVTKRRILVDTWTRDRRLGTVPLEIHVLDYLRRDGLKHPNIVEMADFFEDDVNYYIEMVPHGLPGMDLFDYIELRVNMEEAECRSIFRQVTKAIHHLHTKCLVVHRDIKDENVVLDGEGNIKLIDFGSAAYIKNGPFDVFVGTIGQSLLFSNSIFFFLNLDELLTLSQITQPPKS